MKQKDPLKKEKEEIKILVQATEKFIKELPVNKDDLIGKIKNFNHHYGAFVGSKLVHYEKSDFVKIINSMTPELWKYYLQITEKSIQQNLGEVQLQQIITSKVLEKYPNSNFYIPDFCVYGKDCYGIKFYMYGKGGMFEYDGTINKLAKYLCNIAREEEENIVKCPFCSKCMQKAEWNGVSECDCGAAVVHEVSRPSDLPFIMDYIGGVRIIPKNEDEGDWGIWFLDETSEEIFNKIVSVGENWYAIPLNDYIDKYKYQIVCLKSFLNDIILPPIDKVMIPNNIIITTISKICIDYCFWVIMGETYELTFDGYNRKRGELNKLSMNSFFKIKKYKTVLEYLKEEYTGDYMPGGNYITKEDRVCDEVKHEILKHVCKTLNVAEPFYMTDEQDNLSMYSESFVMEMISKYLGELTTVQCWKDYKDEVLDFKKELDAKHKNKQIKDKKSSELSNELWDKYFPELKDFGQISRNNSKEFMEKLEKIFGVLSKEEFNAMSKNPPHNSFSINAMDDFRKAFSRYRSQPKNNI